MPLVKYVGATATRIGKGNTTIPNFEIIDWIARPDDLPGESEPVTQSKAAVELDDAIPF